MFAQKKFFIALLLSFFVVPVCSAADSTSPTVLPESGDLATKIKNGTMGFADIPGYIGHIIQFFLLIAGALAVLMIIYGGFQYAVGGFNADMKSSGKTTVFHALLGLAVVLLAWFAVDVFINLITSNPA